MHELSVCQALLSQVEKVARDRGSTKVQSVSVKIGPLSGVEPALLETAYATAILGTLAESSRLLIESSPIRICCEACGMESDVASNHLACPGCGDFKARLISGDEMMLMSVEVVI